jgi:acetyl/propionyl-CoA carboxylase alpha subunit/acetyl-CoA carboxylase carboxyltransferase component
MAPDFRRVAIVNRGEAAMRFIRAAREFSLEHDAGLVSIALYTDADRRSLFVREADEAYPLGPALITDPRDGQRKSAYLDYQLLARALRDTGAEAVWVGWGLVAEHAAFSDLCRDLGVVFMGPGGDVMRRLGDKIGSKLLAEEAGVPVARWSGGAVRDLEEARRHGAEIGYPLMIKATAGGGGRGIRRVASEVELAAALASARSEAIKAFGDDTVFLEGLIQGARHVEVQVLGDRHGRVWALGVRDCSVQRRHQKLIEETPSPALTDDEERFLCDASARLATAAGYCGAGTVEYLFEPASRRFSFLEVNARLQVEHPVTELVTGVDLVKLQIQVARGGHLGEEPPAPRGHAIEARLNAEDPDRDFAPSPGQLEVFRPAQGPGLRLDSGVEEGDRIPAEFDSMIAKLVAWGADRPEALARLRRGLAETALVIRGGASNKAYLQELLARTELATGEVDVQWLDRLSTQGHRLPARHAAVALVEAAIEAYEAQVDVERTRFWSTAARGRPEVGDETGRTVELRYRGRTYAFRVHRTTARGYRLVHREHDLDAEAERLGASERRLTCGGRIWRVFSVVHGVDHLVEVDGVPHRVSHGEAGVVRSPAPAVVVSLAVREGDEVAAGDRLAVLEAMKMETAVLAEFPGRVARVLVRPNVQVAAGAPLLHVEPTEEETTAEGELVSFAALAAPGEGGAARSRCLANLERLRQIFLGWDFEPGEPARIVTQHRILCGQLPPDDAEVLRAEERLLAAFADVAALFSCQPDDEAAAELRRATQEYLFTYLRDPGGRGRGLPAAFLDALRRALAHYGLADLEPGPEVREALFRLVKAHRRLDAQLAPVLGVLERRLDAADALGPSPAPLRELMQRLVDETRGRYPAVHDLAREVQYHDLDQPFLGELRRRNLAAAEADLARLLAGRKETAEDKREAMARLLACPHPLHALFARRFAGVDDEGRRLMLEVLVRRTYGLGADDEVETLRFRGHSFAATSFDDSDRRVHLVASHAPWEDFPRVAELSVKRLRRLPRKEPAVADFFLHRETIPENAEAAATEVRARLVGADLPARLERVTVALTSAAEGAGRVDYFTFLAAAGGWEEQRLGRGLHPQSAERLQLWRLGNFALERLPAAEEVYAFRGRAHDNPGDERLFVAAEVRDLTPLPDPGGGAMRYPHLERVFHEALAVVRRYQARLPPEGRLHWNRVTLYVRPPLDLPPAILRALVRRLAPAAEGLGLQKVVVFGRMRQPGGRLAPTVLEISQPAGGGVVLRFREPADEPLETLSPYQSEVVKLRRRGLAPPYEVVRLLAPPRGSESELPPGEFVEYDLDDDGRPVPVERPPGQNRANIVLGLIRSFTDAYPEGMTRVLLASDPGRGMGALAEPECARILAGLELAERLGVPVEWFATSGGAKIAMESGTENMDWIARVLRKLIVFTQAGGEVNLVVPGVNVGAQPYWNAEATMLMHTRGILVMTPDGAMVLTGKQALDYSGGVSAEDNQGIGGYERVMGPNGQAQYLARDLGDACRILLAWYERTYVAPGEQAPRRRPTADPADRDVGAYQHGGEFELVGEVFSDETNPGRKRPFDIRRVMASVVDQDRDPLERWHGMADAEIAVVWDAFVGGWAISLVGFESHPIPRLGFHSADGPDLWTSGTLFPLSSKKVARALNSASGRRPVVILANLSGFDGSPESMRKLQLEFGAEIGRAVVNFRGPLVFCVISRYHGGAFVVFSNALNDNLQVAALAGSYASVIGGAPAAAVVFAREVEQRAKADPRLAALAGELAAADGPAAARLRHRMAALLEEVRSEKLGEVAAEFDRVHSVERARRVGSVHEIIAPARLRPWLIAAVERGMDRARRPAQNSSR